MSTDPKVQADAEKALGNEAYKKKSFAEAATHYTKAWELHKDITYLNNLAAVYLEEGSYEKAIEAGEKAVEEGRELRADFKSIAKSLNRVGSAHLKLKNYEEAIKYLQKSLTEQRAPDTLNKLKDAEFEKAEQEKAAYFNPELSDKARDEGNQAFKQGDFATAVSHYAESIKRNPKDPRGYTNRAAALTKLLALPEALKDSEKAIEADPTFVKAYIRKALVLQGMKEHESARKALQAARAADKDGKNAREIDQQLYKLSTTEFESRAGETEEQTAERAMRDPEVQRTISDPVMQSILQQAQQDPQSLIQHMQNPDIRRKVELLMRAGIIRTK